MTILITGGSGSGKSEYAENKAVEIKNGLLLKNIIYAAAMIPFGEETAKKIERHRKMRRGKGFITKECYKIENIVKLDKFIELKKSTVLIECMSNLTANEIFNFRNENAAEDIINGIKETAEKCGALIIVTNEVFSDGKEYDGETAYYMKCLGKINCALAEFSEEVIEVVCGVPIFFNQVRKSHAFRGGTSLPISGSTISH